ncbi:AAA family ATPase [Mesobacillus jeotgali]|uniref:AAA family ATPase n=1 Tax=Mesobacillus jeotgali TaxID=129985 RepID=UPI0009A59DC0|nr:AAA family ATPase [Mesobacillus jeotgali]
MDQHKKQIPLEEQLLLWQEEIDEKGFVRDEAGLITAIKVLTNNDDPKRLSLALTLAAQSRSSRNGFDSIVLEWLKSAVGQDAENKKAKFLLGSNQWKNKRNLFDTLAFPRIRETDNRALKKKTAEQYIDISRHFLGLAEEVLEDLKNPQHDENSDAGIKFVRLAGLVERAIDETAALLKATELYEESVTGVFHTAVHFEEMKKRMQTLEDIKFRWEEEFAEEMDSQGQSQIDPLAELNQMVGLESVKGRVNDFYRFLKYQQKRKELGLQSKDDQSLNMVLTGNPGTGKTSLARLLAKIYHQLGVLPREDIIEADRSQLVGAYVGQTEENVRKIAEQALGGVLFIDEAYSLKREGQTGNDYGQTAIDTLVSLMTGNEYGGKFAVILAGYPEEMRQFLDANPGLRSRFPQSNFIHLPDYTDEELMQIAEQAAQDNDYAMTESAKLELRERIEKERVDDTFGNARTVRNLVLEAIFKKGSRQNEDADFSTYTLLEKEDFESTIESSAEKPVDRLNALVGLDTVKSEVTSLISFVRMQQLRKEKGLPAVPIQLHSVFTGNPGTGKTTVAKIYAELLKECGMLKRGHLITSSRADFVAGYVGQTAIKTKKKIREALGGVLFIDEAYSLLGQTSGDFGKEVIDTLVDEMTRHNENLVVILAGYPSEIDTLLESNPGLRSRFKKFFHFPDYSAGELLLIIRNYAGKYQYKISGQAIEFLSARLSETEINGNGRFATNLVDEAIQSQAYRLMSGEPAGNLDQEVINLEKQDFEAALTKILS